MKARRTGKGSRGGEIGGIAFDVEDHVAANVADGGMGMTCCIVKEMFDGRQGGFGARGLLSSKCADGRKHGGVNGPGVEEEGAEDFLDAFGVCKIECR